jgi:hypothetical protein
LAAASLKALRTQPLARSSNGATSANVRGRHTSRHIVKETEKKDGEDCCIAKATVRIIDALVNTSEESDHQESREHARHADEVHRSTTPTINIKRPYIALNEATNCSTVVEKHLFHCIGKANGVNY